jgi:NADH:ubiquinone oxidoreductase subunit 2 (subunit N)
VALAIIAALNTAVSLCYYIRIVRAMFIDEPVGELVVRPKINYQIMLGTSRPRCSCSVSGGRPSSSGHKTCP